LQSVIEEKANIETELDSLKADVYANPTRVELKHYKEVCLDQEQELIDLKNLKVNV
jgi:hypothetical protein